jgi:hypothetical protein
VRVRSLVVLATTLTACAGLTGLSDYDFEEPSPTATPDGSPNDSPDASVHDGAVVSDAIAPKDADGAAVVDAATCTLVTATNDVIRARRVSKTAITVDGDPSEWPCTNRVRVDATTAAVVFFGPSTSTAALELAWAPEGLFYLAQVTDRGAPSGDDLVRVFDNDAVEVFIGANTPHPGLFNPTDFQFIVDYAGRAQVYRNNSLQNGAVDGMGLQSAAKVNGNAFVVEGFIPSSALGYQSIDPQAPHTGNPVKVGFDFQVDEHAATLGANSSSAYWLFERPPPGYGAGDCSGSQQAPYCNETVWGSVQLDP